MTFEELSETLPNGFHDAKIRTINLDFVASSILIGMNVQVGLPDSPNRNEYRAGTLVLVAPCLFFVEPPDPRYPFVPHGSPLNIDEDSVKPGQNEELDRLLPVLPPNASPYRFFLEEWNSFLYLAAGDVVFSWDDVVSAE